MKASFSNQNKRIHLSLSVTLIAIILSAFSNKKQTGAYYGQTSPGIYSSVDYHEGTCYGTTVLPCLYIITSAGVVAGIDSQAPFDINEITQYLNQPSPYLKEHSSSSNKMWVPIP